MIKRVDPTDCGCTDCLTGYSKPFDQCTPMELLYMGFGNIKNASEYEPDTSFGLNFKYKD